MLFYMTEEGREGRNAFNENAVPTSPNTSGTPDDTRPLPLSTAFLYPAATEPSRSWLRVAREGLLVRIDDGWGDCPRPDRKENLQQAEAEALAASGGSWRWDRARKPRAAVGAVRARLRPS